MRQFIVATLCTLSFGLATVSQADSFKPSKADQVKLGQRAATDLRKKEKVLPSSDSRVVKLREVGNKILTAMNVKGEPWQFTFDVIQSKEINAFALPGGPVFFYTGILDKIKTEDELAGIMGHEMTHVMREHWAYAYAESQKRQLGIAVVLGILGANRTAGSIAGITNALVFDLPYSRNHETQADEQGIDVMIRAGYNPQGMADVFRMLSSQSKGSTPEFLSTHPNSKARITNIETRIAKMNRDFPTQRPLVFAKSSMPSSISEWWDARRLPFLPSAQK